ncbi:unnamed protein product [Trifolium pratense]|uniref:Uncharacterized protein n=1 Tax=Trifolium pratense TaxID=57577 RepID=A0ACB0KRZ5_TRIPR|nr:unnamed protein product [Trifolium pratense]
MESVGSTHKNTSSRETVIHIESVGSTHKKQRDEDDIISKLPDSFISHILSFLPTKDAVRTSVLSKRWIECWRLITQVNFDDSLFYSPEKKSGGKQCFINFVNRVLLLSKACRLESVSLVITKNYDVSLLNTWISCILNKDVKKLSICSNLELNFSALMSRTLFNNSTNLQELVLEMRHCAIKVPCWSYYHTSFGNLQVLKLRGIIFTMDKSYGILLEALKKFEAKNCSWLSSRDATIKAPLLESVLIEQDLEFVTREPRSCKINFNVSRLKEFTYCGDGISQAFILSDTSSAHNADANIILDKRGNSVQETGSCACLLLKQFSQARCIKFHGSGVLTQQNVAVLPKFAMLSHLELGSVSGEVLLRILQKAPVLNTLFFKEISKFEQKLLNSAVVPGCFASTLKVVKFENVYGSEHELFLAKFFMENGIVLERMSFSFVDWRWRREKLIEEFKEKLYSFKKGISFAILEFRY